MKNKNIRIKAALALIATLILGLCVNAYAASLKQTEAYYVNDYADVMERDTENHIIAANVSLEEQTGAQVVVVTVDFTDGKAIDEYAYDLFNSWGIGTSGKDNGVLLLLAIGDDNYYCVPGTGLEQTLSADVMDNILNRYLEPDFADKDYSAGVAKTFDAIISRLESYYGISVSAGGSTQAQTAEAYPNNNSNTAANTSRQSGGFGYSLFNGLFTIIIILLVVIVIISSLQSVFRPVYRPRPFLFPWFPRRHHHHHHYHHRHHPLGGGFGGPPPFGGPGGHGPGGPGPGQPRSTGGMFTGGGGAARGGGAGRRAGSGGISGGGMFGGSRPSGGMGRPSGGMRTGGGGATRGGGAGRRK